MKTCPCRLLPPTAPTRAREKRLPHKAASLSRERLGATTTRPARLPPARSSRNADALAEQAADAADTPWLQELQAPAEHAEEREKWDFVLAEADKADRRRQAWAVPLRFVLGLSYLLALGLLLAFLPDLGHVLQASPAQLQLFALALLVAERGGACQAGLVGALRALRRAGQEARIYAQLAAEGHAEAREHEQQAVLAGEHARELLLRLAAAAPLQLGGAVLAALAPAPAPGVALLLAAQLPLHAFRWHADEHGVLAEVPPAMHSRLLRADVALLAAAVAQAAAGAAPASAAGALALGAAFAQLAIVLHAIWLGREATAPPPAEPALSAV